MSADSFEMLWRQEKDEHGFGQKTGLNKGVCVCMAQVASSKCGGKDAGGSEVMNPAGRIVVLCCLTQTQVVTLTF